MDRTSAKAIALGGVLAALAVVMMSLGGLIPIATFVLPVLCMLTGQTVLKLCGRKIAWAWYGAVALLGLLLGPDKEAGAVFLALGYYPILKPKLDRSPLRWLWKGILFNGVIFILYWALMHIFGMAQLLQESRELGFWGVTVTLVLGNITFFLLDILLSRLSGRKRRNG